MDDPRTKALIDELKKLKATLGKDHMEHVPPPTDHIPPPPP
jgi:hypothetical protein